MNPFDFVKSINYQKQDLMEDDVDKQVESEYVPYIVNKALSHTCDTILYANETNQRPFLDKKLQYHYLLNTIRPKNRFGKWLKFEKSEKLEIIQQYYNYSLQKAKQVESIFSDDDIKTLKSKLYSGGLKEKDELNNRFAN
jgi:hypothetical protein